MTQRVIKTCKDCNKPFSISGNELEWLKNIGLTPFKRCSECRKKRKQQRR